MAACCQVDEMTCWRKPLVSRFFCRWSLETGVILISALSLIISFASLGNIIYLVISKAEISLLFVQLESHGITLFAVFIVTSNVTGLVAAILLFAAERKKKRTLLIPWLIFSTISVGLSLEIIISAWIKNMALYITITLSPAKVRRSQSGLRVGSSLDILLMAPHLKSCCCFSLRTGAKIIGALGMIGSVFSLALLMYSQFSERADPMRDVVIAIIGPQGEIVMIAMNVISSLLWIITSFSLLVAVSANKRVLVLPWLIYLAASLLGAFIIGFTFLVKTRNTFYHFIVGFVIVLPLALYFWWVIFTFYQKMGGNPSEQRR